ncbi:MAG: nucleotidyltransferase family protein [Verrucomicrobiota bacterium]
MQMNEQRGIVCGVIILAAGASSRMGRPKMLLPWGATSVLGHLIGQWQTLGAEQIAVVCAVGDSAVPGELRRLGFPLDHCILNPTPESGMFSSIQCAARWLGWNPDLTHWAILLGDQPHLRPETLRALLDFAAAQPARICQPSRTGRPRHPVLLPAATFAQLKISSAENLKQFLQTRFRDLALCEMDDPGLDMDIDQPGDYERAIQVFMKKA